MSLRSEVLKCFKKLHRTRKLIFDGDVNGLTFARNTINSEFRENKDIRDRETIEKLLEHGRNMEVELRTTVIQAKEVTPGVFRARILPETEKLENVEFNLEAIEEAYATGKLKRGKRSKCCQEQKEPKTM